LNNINLKKLYSHVLTDDSYKHVTSDIRYRNYLYNENKDFVPYPATGFRLDYVLHIIVCMGFAKLYQIYMEPDSTYLILIFEFLFYSYLIYALGCMLEEFGMPVISFAKKHLNSLYILIIKPLRLMNKKEAINNAILTRREIVHEIDKLNDNPEDCTHILDNIYFLREYHKLEPYFGYVFLKHYGKTVGTDK